MTFSSEEKKKFKFVKNVIIVWYFGYKPLSNDKYIQKWFRPLHFWIYLSFDNGL